MQLSIATITLGDVRMEYMQSVMEAHTDPIVDKVLMLAAGHYLDVARNRCVETFLANSDADWLLFVDSDTTFTVADLYTLLSKADPDVHRVIGGVYLTTSSPIGPVVYRWGDSEDLHTESFIQVTMDDIRQAERDDCGYVPVDGVGTGFMAIHRSLLSEMLDYWDRPTSPFAEKVVNGLALGEDFTFCARVKQMGYQVYIHPDVRVGHVKTVLLIEEDK